MNETGGIPKTMIKDMCRAWVSFMKRLKMRRIECEAQTLKLFMIKRRMKRFV